MMKTQKRRALLAALAALLLLGALCAAAGLRARALLYAALDGRSAPEARADEAPVFALGAETAREQATTRAAGWQSVVTAEELTLEGPRGALSATLYGAITGEEDAPIVLALHGGQGTARAQVLDAACRLSLAGYRVLTPDLYGHGRSAGTLTALGVRDAKDVRAWVDFLLEREPDARVALFGQDEGALAALLAAGEGLPENVRAAALDAPLYDVSEYLGDALSRLGEDGALERALLGFAARLWLGESPAKVDPEAAAQKCGMPLLILCGTLDEESPAWRAQDVAAAAEDARVVLIEGAAHGAARYQDEDGYYSALLSFFEEAFGR